MRTRIGATLLALLFLAPGAFGVLINDHERPPEEELTALPSLDPENRDELREYLAVVRQYYQYEYWEAMADELSDDYREGQGLVLRADVEAGAREIDIQTSRSVRVPLHPVHDPWLFEAAWQLLDEDPVDWRTIVDIGDILMRFPEKHPEGVNIALHMVERPLQEIRERPPYEAAAGFNAYQYLVRHWPEEAARILAALVTLPHQPKDRVIHPPHPEATEAEVEERERRNASTVRGILERNATPEELAEVAEHIEADVEAGAYELDAEMEEWLESIRQ
ncbi:MAG: hypothetical protein ACLFU6_08490 [Candidatus Hydrogenedentota bacterium]